MLERGQPFDFNTYQLGPGEVKGLIQYPRRAKITTISRKLRGMGFTVDRSYEPVVLDPTKPFVVVRGIGTVDAIRSIRESGKGIKFFGEGRISPA